jgi:hypothetical protein
VASRKGGPASVGAPGPRTEQKPRGERSRRAPSTDVSSKEARSDDEHQHAPPSGRFADRFQVQPLISSTSRETRAADIRAAYERGELATKETAEESAARNAAYDALHGPPPRVRVGRKVGAATEAVHRKRFTEGKPWKQCFGEYYTESRWKPQKPKIKQFETMKRNNVKAYERRLQEAKKQGL